MPRLLILLAIKSGQFFVFIIRTDIIEVHLLIIIMNQVSNGDETKNGDKSLMNV